MKLHYALSKITFPRLLWLFIIGLAGLEPAAQAQNLVVWPFGTTGFAPNPTPANVTTVAPVYVNAGATQALAGGNPTKYFECDQWNNATTDLNRYFEVSVSPAINYDMAVTGFSMSVANNSAADGPKNYDVRVSTNNFASSVCAVNNVITTTNQTFVCDFANALRSTNKFTIRVYFSGAQLAAKTIRIGNATILGDVQLKSLPVELISFRGQATGNTVILNWSTASEQNADRFLIQRSSDASEFISVGSRQSAGTTDRQQYYSLTDESPRNGLNYYRLKQVDRDGSAVYSKAIAVRVDASQPYASLVENPTDGQAIQLKLYRMEAPQVRLTSLTGQTISGQTALRSATEAVYTPVSPLTPGLYIITVQENAVRQAMKVLVK